MIAHSKKSQLPLPVVAAQLDGVKKRFANRGAPIPHPATTSTTTPAGIMANDPDAVRDGARGPARPAAAASSVVRSTRTVVLLELDRHPDNREPTAERIASLAESIKRDGLLERIVCRDLPGGKLQMLSGETRQRALLKIHGGFFETTVEVMHGVDDAKALELLATFNAKRTDLDAIEKGRLIKRLCEPTANGGGGLLRDAAAKIYGLDTGAAASNLVRLLELPDVWQRRVASGELQQTFARLLLPYVYAPRLMAAIDADYQRSMKHKQGHEPERWSTRSNLEDHLERVVDEHTRTLDPKEELHYQSKHFAGEHRYTYPWFVRLFDLTPELEKAFDIIELTQGKTKKRYATNCERFDALQLPLVRKKIDDSEKRAAAKSGRSGKTGGGSKSADPKKLAAEKREQLARRVKGWRHAWLQRLVASAIGNPKTCPTWIAVKFVVWLSSAHDYMLRHVAPAKRLGDVVGLRNGDAAAAIARFDATTSTGYLHDFAAAALSVPSRDPHHPDFPGKLLDDLATALDVDLRAAWRELSAADLTTFLELHQCDQLDPLAEEWGVFVDPKHGKAARIKLLVGNAKARKLPTCVPVVARKKVKK